MPEIYGPRQVILVTCRYNNINNILPVAWHTPLSFSPMLYGIAIGKNRYSHKLIKNSKCFCINFISYKDLDTVLKTGTCSGRNIDKFRKFNIKTEECERIDCIRLKDSIGFIECLVVNEIDSGDHTFFVGDIKKSKLRLIEDRLLHVTGKFFKRSEKL